jgi:hypothetical protein
MDRFSRALSFILIALAGRTVMAKRAANREQCSPPAYASGNQVYMTMSEQVDGVAGVQEEKKHTAGVSETSSISSISMLKGHVDYKE